VRVSPLLYADVAIGVRSPPTGGAAEETMSFDDPVIEPKTDTALCPACLVPHPVLSEDEFWIVVDCPSKPRKVTTRG